MIWLRQALVVLAGLGVAAAMVVLGIWQLDVYTAQGTEVAAARAAEPPVPLTSVAPAGGVVRDGYGRSVTVSGTYLLKTQLMLPTENSPDRVRVVTALRQADGSVVPVLRGLAPRGAEPIPPPEPVTQTGVLLPSEEAVGSSAEPPEAIRVPALAQSWPGPLVDGYVSADSAGATGQGLQPAPVRLPEARGRLRNGAYALQWWVFAAFALGMAIRIARDLRIGEDLAALPDPEAPAADDLAPTGDGTPTDGVEAPA